MPELAVEKDFDWTVFVERYWDRQPVLFQRVEPAPFVEEEAFPATVHAQGPNRDDAIPIHVRLTIERKQQTTSGGYLPVDTDQSFDDYERRIADQLDGLRYAVIVNALHAFDFPLWTRERDFFAPLWERIGLPVTGAITTLFHGTYEHSPVGVHKDRFATFMFGLRGRKKMRFWPNRPWTQPVTTVLDYQPYLPESFAAEVGPGNLLYWPSTYYHVGENAGTTPATSVNVGIPREGHSVGYELDEILVDRDPATLANTRSGVLALLPAVTASLSFPASGPDGLLSSVLPAAFEEALGLYRELEWDDRLTIVSLRKWTAGGFQPVPSPAPLRSLADDDVIYGDPRWPMEFTSNGACAVNGHAWPTELSLDTLRHVREALQSGQPIRVGNLPPECRRLLQRLESFCGIGRLR